MEYRFQLLKIRADTKTRCVKLTFSLDIEEESVPDNIYLMRKAPRGFVPCDIKVDGKQVYLYLRERPVPNTDYSLIIEPGKVFSITEEKLETVAPTTIVFDEVVTSDVKILSPTNFDEELGEIQVTWQELGESLTFHYCVEVAKENTFVNLVYHGTIDKTEQQNPLAKYTALLPAVKEPGQYYIRMRSEGPDGYGEWSETVTVVFPQEKTSVPNPQPEGGNPRPDLPEIHDFVKEEDTASTRDPVKTDTPVWVPLETTPDKFNFVFTAPVNIDNAMFHVERRDT